MNNEQWRRETRRLQELKIENEKSGNRRLIQLKVENEKSGNSIQSPRILFPPIGGLRGASII